MIVPAATRRTSTTPNATMTTLASPSLGGASASLWLVDMVAGAVGPVHAFAAEVIWSMTRGRARLDVGDEAHDLATGDTVVLPGGVLRRFTAGPQGCGAVVTTCGAADVVRDVGTDVGVPPWVA